MPLLHFTNKDLHQALAAIPLQGASLTDRLKVAYRPYICPFKSLLTVIAPHKSVFDIGCGSGMFLYLVKRYRNATQLGGIEVSKTLIDNARQLLGQSSFLAVYDGSNLPTEIADYDYVTLIDVLHHIPKAQHAAYLAQLYAHMRPGATLIFKDMRADTPLVYWNKLHDLLLGDNGGQEISPSQAQQLLQQAGFTTSAPQCETMLTYAHYTIYAKK